MQNPRFSRINLKCKHAHTHKHCLTHSNTNKNCPLLLEIETGKSVWGKNNT